MLYHLKFTGCMLVVCFALHAQQPIQWERLNGPNGLYEVDNLVFDSSGRGFLVVQDSIYCSLDDGITWNPCMNGLQGAQTGSVGYVFNSTQRDILYIRTATHFYRFDALTNGWVKINGINPVKVSVDLQGRFWTIGPGQKIRYSNDEGNTWTQILLQDTVVGYFNEVYGFTDDHNLLLAGYGSSISAYHFSVDGQVKKCVEDWPAYIRHLSFNPYGNQIFVSGSQEKLRSEDGGLTWQAFDIFNPYGSNETVLRFTYEPGGRIWAHCFTDAYFSDDSGVSWRPDTIISEVNSLQTYRSTSGTWFANNSCGRGTTFGRSVDQGLSWMDLTQQFQRPGMLEILQVANNRLFAKTCNRYSYIKSIDGGQTWEEMVVATDSVDVYLRHLVMNNKGVYMGIGTNDRLYRSTDDGQSWMLMDSLFLSNPPIKFFIDVHTDRYGAFYVGTSIYNYKSLDNGDSWSPFFTPLLDAGKKVVFHPNGDVYFDFHGFLSIYAEALDTGLNYFTLDDFDYFGLPNLHCTAKGVVFISIEDITFGAPPTDVFRFMPDGSYQPEPVFFFANQPYPKKITSNALGDLFVSAGDRLFRSIDDGITWDSLGTLPGVPKVMYCGADQHLYLGFDNMPMLRSLAPTNERNQVTGRIWSDLNDNCQFDTSDLVMNEPLTVTAEGVNGYTAISTQNGNFALALPSGDFNISVRSPSPLLELCQPAVPVSLSGPNDSAHVELPLQVVEYCPYMSVYASVPFLRRCFPATYTIHYKNEGTAPATGRYVTLTLDSFFVFQSATLPVAWQNGLAYRFDVGDIAPGQGGMFQAIFITSCDAPLGQEHCLSANVFPDALCLPTLSPLSAYQECRLNIGSFDPNDKQAFVDGRPASGAVLPNTNIEYLIRFQNTGTDTAFRVVVEDRLSILLDPKSITPLVASHPYSIALDDRNVLRFVFENILLPDSNINEPGSHGFIKFRIAQKPDVPIGSVISNSADIFFDFNAPVHTNTSRLTVGTVNTIPAPLLDLTINAYPNPFTDQVTFEITGPANPGELTLRVFDTLGREVRREQVTGRKHTMTRSDMAPGVYYFLVENGRGLTRHGILVLRV